MKHFNIILVILLLLGSCKQPKSQSEIGAQKAVEVAYTAVGDPVSEGKVLPEAEMARAFKEMQAGDTLHVSKAE